MIFTASTTFCCDASFSNSVASMSKSIACNP